MPPLPFAVGEPAEGEEIGRFEQADTVGHFQPQPGVQFVGDIGESRGAYPGVHLVIE